jgi:hypothetical protein
MGGDILSIQLILSEFPFGCGYAALCFPRRWLSGALDPPFCGGLLQQAVPADSLPHDIPCDGVHARIVRR